MHKIEEELLSQGFGLMAGVDEVGRGPLAGPVVTACVCLPLDDIIDGITDSKKLSEKKREKLYDEIISKAKEYRIAIVDEKIIDEINILNATKQAMRQCINDMTLPLDCVLIDAVKLDKVKFPTKAYIKGDLNSYLIGAASIIAKVTRDRMMRDFDKLYPQYGFAKNKGYGTAEHISALKKIGLCEIHRVTFTKHFVK